MDSTTKAYGIILVILIILLLVLFAFYFTNGKRTSYTAKSVTDISYVVDELVRKDIGLATMKGCGYCTKQHQVLGEHKHRLSHCCVNDSSDCNYEIPEDIRKKMRGFPCFFSKRTGEVYPGYKDAQALIKFAQDVQ